MSTGDKVIFPLLNQRVDKKDLNDMQVLLQETVGRTLASLLGEGGGALTTIPFTWDDVTDIVTFGPFMMAYSGPEDTSTNVNLLDGGVVIHDPTRPGQNGYSTVNLSGIGVLGYLWFKRYTTEADFDNRAYWPGPGTGEQIIGTNTREREYVRFAVTDSLDDATYNNSTGWWRFATFQKTILLGTTTLFIYPISAIGDDRGAGANGVVQLMGSSASTVTGSTPSRKWGLNRLAQDVITSIIQMKDSDVTFDPTTRAVTANPSNTFWRDTPAIGLRQVSSSLSILETTVETLNSNIFVLNQLIESMRTAQIATPQILGFIDVAVSWTTATQANTSVTVRYGGNGSAGQSTFTAELVSGVEDYVRKIRITVVSPSIVIDHIEGSAFMSLKSTTFSNLSITEGTKARSLVSGKIDYPKTSGSIPASDGREGNVTIDDPLPDDYVTTGQFVITAKVARADTDSGSSWGEGVNVLEPFTLVVYGRNLALGA
jgi:hypothetical protein